MKNLLIILASIFGSLVAHATTCGNFTITGTCYYMWDSAHGASDGNNGLSTAHPWQSANHAVNSGDMILAQPATDYDSYNFGQNSWGTVTSTNNNVAWLACSQFDACIVSVHGYGMWVSSSHWGVMGFELQQCQTEPNCSSGQNQNCFQAAPASTSGPSVDHIIFANDIANGCSGGGIGIVSQGAYGADYVVIIGSIVYAAGQGNSECFSGIDLVEPLATDALPGTHIYVAGNYTYNNVDPADCNGSLTTDGEGILFDTWDGLTYNQQAVAENNLSFLNGLSAIKVVNSTHAKFYIKNNTAYGDNQGPYTNATWCGELLSQTSDGSEYYNNLIKAASGTGCGGNTNYLLFNASPNTGDVMYANFGYSPAGNNTGNSGGFTFGPNNVFGTDPAFVNAPASNPGAPSCGSYASVPACMATLIADFVPTVAAAKPYGYQTISTTSVYNPLYPQWLCSVTNLPIGLVTPGCTTGMNWK